jgi:hypothetical protein
MLSRNLPNEENHEKPQLRELVSRLKFEPGTSRTRSRNVNHSTKTVGNIFIFTQISHQSVLPPVLPTIHTGSSWQYATDNTSDGHTVVPEVAFARLLSGVVVSHERHDSILDERVGKQWLVSRPGNFWAPAAAGLAGPKWSSFFAGKFPLCPNLDQQIRYRGSDCLTC